MLLIIAIITISYFSHGKRAFSIVGPSTWNGLPLDIRLLPNNNESVFYRLLKTDLYRRGSAGGASE